MIQRLRAIFRQGAFIPRSRCELPEETEVELQVDGPLLISPSRSGSNGAAVAILKQVADRMRNNPMPANAPRFTRDDLHARG